MAPQFKIGSDQPLTVASPSELLASIESLVNGCLERGNVFAIIHYKGSFTQLFLDEDDDMHIETSLGDLAEYAGFNQSVPGFDWLAGNVLPADWHGRAKMAAEAMSRAFIDAANMAFPAELTYSIHPTQGEPPPPPPPHPQEPGHPTLGFCFGADLPMNSFIDELGPPLGVTSRSLEAIFDAIQAGLETQHGKLTRTADWLHANMIVEIGGTGPVDAPNVIRFSAPHGTLVITDFEPQRSASTR